MSAKKKSEPMSLCYAKALLISKSPSELLAAALRKAQHGINEPGGMENLLKLVDFIESDLNDGKLRFIDEAVPELITEEPEEQAAPRMYKGYNIDELSWELSQEQIGYLAGLSKKAGLDRYNLPSNISPKRNYKELTEGEAIIVIDTLKEMIERV